MIRPFGIRMGKKFRRYLEWANFDIGEGKPRYKVRLWIDALLARAYTVFSVILIWIQAADMAVFGLNTICLFRSLIHNTLNASEITASRNVEEKHEQYSHYHVKVLILFVSAVLFGIVWILLGIEKSANVGLLIKVFASIAIGIICLNDLEELVIYAYSATIK